jgi:threonine dehydratase
MPTASRCTSSTPDLGLLEHYVKKILAAPVYDLAVHTPLQGAPGLSAALGNQVLLKREDLQPTFSFKVRGAYNRLVQLSDAQRQRGVITASAGNHAQGVALAARELGIKATIVMPRSTPELKVQGVRSRDAEVLLHGESFPFALAHALALAQHNGQTFVSPFDDPEVIAGQGTVAMEILRQQPGRLDAIFVPVGGGGLIAGIAAYVKYLRPEVRIIGVESAHSNCLQQALKAGERVLLPEVGTFADGVAVAQVGAHCFEICRHHVDQVLTVSNDDLCTAIKAIYDDTRSITEPSGALAVAGIQQYVASTGARGQTLVAIDSGANINFATLAEVAKRLEPSL